MPTLLLKPDRFTRVEAQSILDAVQWAVEFKPSYAARLLDGADPLSTGLAKLKAARRLPAEDYR
jgi:hypothetical protein